MCCVLPSHPFWTSVVHCSTFRCMPCVGRIGRSMRCARQPGHTDRKKVYPAQECFYFYFFSSTLWIGKKKKKSQLVLSCGCKITRSLVMCFFKEPAAVAACWMYLDTCCCCCLHGSLLPLCFWPLSSGVGGSVCTSL